MGRTQLAVLLIVMWVGTAKAQERPRKPYSLQVFKADVLPTKSDGRVWDGTTVVKNLPAPKGLTPVAFAAAVGKKLLEAGLDATAAPDVYVVVEANGKKLQTSVVQDTYSANWGSSDSAQALTVALRTGDYLQILDVAIELKALAKPISAEECRALAAHVVKLAEAAGQAQSFERLKTLSLDDLRACISGTSRSQFECVMGAADLGAVSTCK